MQLHHATLFVRDAERSLRFYRDGLGFTVLVDREFDSEWPALLGDPDGILVELLDAVPRRGAST